MDKLKKYLLKDIAVSQTGPFGSQLHEKDYVQDGTPIVTVEHLGEIGFYTDNLPLVSDKDKARLSKYTLKEGDIVFSRVGSIDRCTYVSKKEEGWLFSGRCLRVRFNEKADPKFISYYFRQKYFKEMMLNISVGATMPSLNTTLMDNIPLFLPEKSEQQKIAAVLSALDAKIELNARINAELEQVAKTLYDYWFVQFEFPTTLSAPLSFGHPPKYDMETLGNTESQSVVFGGTEGGYKSAGGKMVWNEALKREIPLGWEVGSLLDIADYMNGLPCQKFRPTGKDFLRVIKIREMRDGFTEDSELVRPDIPEKAIIENGDVLFSWSASLEVMIWSGGKGALNQHIFKVTSEKYPKSFYYFQLVNYLQHFKMMAENRKTTMGHITQDHLKQSRVVLPPKELTEELEKIIAPIFEKILVNKQESQTLTELRDWLLPMLMNGQVAVK